MNENLYIAHKKLPHKTLRVHSARYTQCIHVSSRKLKLPKDIHLHILCVNTKISVLFNPCVFEIRYKYVPLVEIMYLVFTRMPYECYCRRRGSLLLYLSVVFRALINSLVC